MRGADALARILKLEGVEVLFSYPNHALIDTAAKVVAAEAPGLVGLAGSPAAIGADASDRCGRGGGAGAGRHHAITEIGLIVLRVVHLIVPGDAE